MAPASLYHRMLAGAYQELGYLLLTRGETRAARGCGVESLRNALRYVVTTRSGFSNRWLLSAGLVPLTLVPWPLVRSVWRARNHALGREFQPWPVVAPTPPEHP